ncbi:MAG TPA: hypothetical protein VD902_04885, partial [Symbiobacteriaceae bacterium]|nr:hypothetical protein [Symbiobacteriaceae bacterium]
MPQPRSRSRDLLAALALLAVLGVGGAEYYRYDLTSRAAARESTARMAQEDAARLRQREKALEP